MNEGAKAPLALLLRRKRRTKTRDTVVVQGPKIPQVSSVTIGHIVTGNETPTTIVTVTMMGNVTPATDVGTVRGKTEIGMGLIAMEHDFPGIEMSKIAIRDTMLPAGLAIFTMLFRLATPGIESKWDVPPKEYRH